jgi:RNA polymerase sigma-70 factor, ECF subfamily
MELARGVVRNDPACVAAFFQAYHAGVFRYMLCLTGDLDDAEDLAQDSLLHAKSHIRSYRGGSGLKTWVHRVAFHVFTHWNRRRKPKMALDAEQLSPDQPFDRVVASQTLLAALSKLGPALSQPLILQEVNDLSIDEIATVLNLPAGTVKSRLSAARQRLRQLIGEP